METHLLADMMLFVQVSDLGSFSAAAEKQEVSKSVVSKRISRLEETLHVRLFQRSTRKLALTDAGQALYQRCAGIAEDVAEAKAAVAEVRGDPRGTLHVNATLGLGYSHLVPAIAAFIKKFPAVHVDLVLGHVSEDLIADGFDLAIFAGAPPDSSMIAKRIMTRDMVVCASPAYFAAHGEPQKPEALSEHNCLLHQSQPHQGEWHLIKDDHEISIPVSGNFTASNGLTLVQAAVNDLGIIMLPEYLVSPAIKAGELKSVLHDYCSRDLDIYAMYPHRRHLAPKVRAFIDFLVQRFNDPTYRVSL